MAETPLFPRLIVIITAVRFYSLARAHDQPTVTGGMLGDYHSHSRLFAPGDRGALVSIGELDLELYPFQNDTLGVLRLRYVGTRTA